MQTSSNGIALIKGLESCSLTAYPDAEGYSIGYGHYGVSAGTVITQAKAEELLKQDLANFESIVNRCCSGLSQRQFDALVSLCYNIGSGNFAGSTVVRLIREGGPQPRAELRTAWQMWNKSKGKTLDALVRRRNIEYDYYACQDVLRQDDSKKKNIADGSSAPIRSEYHCCFK